MYSVVSPTYSRLRHGFDPTRDLPKIQGLQDKTADAVLSCQRGFTMSDRTALKKALDVLMQLESAMPEPPPGWKPGSFREELAAASQEAGSAAADLILDDPTNPTEWW